VKLSALAAELDRNGWLRSRTGDADIRKLKGRNGKDQK